MVGFGDGEVIVEWFVFGIVGVVLGCGEKCFGEGCGVVGWVDIYEVVVGILFEQVYLFCR